MKDDFKFEVQLADHDGGSIMKEVFIDAVVFLRKDVRYRFSLGTTDSAGLMEVSFNQLEQIRRRNQKDNLMDYNTTLQECDSTLELVVPRTEELEQRLEAARRWFAEDADSLADKIAMSKNDEISCASLKIDVGAEIAERVLLKCTGIKGGGGN